MILIPLSAAGPLETFLFKSSDEPESQLEQEPQQKQPIADFFIKGDKQQPKPHRKTPMRTFFFKDTHAQNNQEGESTPSPNQGQQHKGKCCCKCCD